VPDEIWVEPMLRMELQEALAGAWGGLVVHPRLGIGVGIHNHRDSVYASLDFRFSQEA
jgi:hypothetical protein